jgi:phosphate transport system substrate-binding protein
MAGGTGGIRVERDCRMGAMGMTMPVDRTQERRFRGGCVALAGLRLALSVIAGVAWWLAAMPASAQNQQPEARPGAASRTGEAAPPPSGDLAERNQLLIVGSTALDGINEAIIKHLSDAYVMPKPITRLDGTRAGIAAFCAGIGPQYPDIVAATDRLSRAEFETCVENKVLDVIEVDIGYSAVVVVTKKGDQVFNLTPRMVYYGLAEDIPIKGEFKTNENKSWNETDKDAADRPIQVIIPAKGSGTRSFFDDNFMQGGCRHVKEIDAIFAAAERVPLCIRVRDDGPVSEVAEEQVVDALIKAPRGTLAVVGWTVYLENNNKLETLPVKGVQPSHENIDNDSYAMSSTLRYYVKRAHMRGKYGGQGVVQGIREFIDEIVKDEASAEGGYLEKVGMVALGEQDRQVQKKIVRRLKRFEP